MAVDGTLQQEVERVLGSRTFATAPQLRRFLEYCAGHVGEGRQGELKESVIGVEVFGRAASNYDPRLDPIVRVMATRLRKRLDDYYQAETAGARARLVMPKGSYELMLERSQSSNEPVTTEPSIAVLPLEMFSSDGSDEYLADAMTEALITALAKLRGWRVISRTSVLRFKRTAMPMGDIARMLNVDHVVEGSVTRDGNRFCLTVQLIGLPVERHLWAETYERDLADVFRLQQEIAREVAGEIHARLSTAGERIAPEARVNEQAWIAYSEGLYRASHDRDLEQALAKYEEAVRLDSRFALAYAGLAEVCFLLEAYWQRSDLHVKARRAAAQALELDGMLAEAHTAMAAMLTLEWNWQQACEHLETAIRLNSNSAAARRRYAFTLSLLDRHDEARQQAERARRLDPLSPATRDNVGLVLFLGGWQQESAEHLRALIASEPEYPPALVHLAVTLIELGEFDEGERVIQVLLRVRPFDGNAASLLCSLYARRGDAARARAVREEIVRRAQDSGRALPHYGQALMAAALNETDEALDQLHLAFEKSEWMLGYVKTPQFRVLAKEPRYQALVRRVGLPL